MQAGEEPGAKEAQEDGDEDQGSGVEAAVHSNADACMLCNMGGSLLCCDACPAAYHMRCIGESAKSLPPGDWLCPECALGGRGEAFCTALSWMLPDRSI